MASSQHRSVEESACWARDGARHADAEGVIDDCTSAPCRRAISGQAGRCLAARNGRCRTRDHGPGHHEGITGHLSIDVASINDSLRLPWRQAVKPVFWWWFALFSAFCAGSVATPSASISVICMILTAGILALHRVTPPSPLWPFRANSALNESAHPHEPTLGLSVGPAALADQAGCGSRRRMSALGQPGTDRDPVDRTRHPTGAVESLNGALSLGLLASLEAARALRSVQTTPWE